MKREAALKSAFFRELHRQLPEFLVLQLATAGAPDRLVVGNARSSYLEFKHAEPKYESKGNQKLLCLRLAAQGAYCRYVVWMERGREKWTLIVTPQVVHERLDLISHCEAVTEGFDHRWLVQRVKEIHGLT